MYGNTFNIKNYIMAYKEVKTTVVFLSAFLHIERSTKAYVQTIVSNTTFFYKAFTFAVYFFSFYDWWRAS